MRKQVFKLDGRVVTLYAGDVPQILQDSEKRTARAFCWIAATVS